MAKTKAAPADVLKSIPRLRKGGQPLWLESVPLEARKWVQQFVVEVKALPPIERPRYCELLKAVQENTGVAMSERTLRKMLTE